MKQLLGCPLILVAGQGNGELLLNFLVTPLPWRPLIAVNTKNQVKAKKKAIIVKSLQASHVKVI